MGGRAKPEQRPTGFGPILARLREAAGLTQEDLAAKSGLHLGGIRKLEQGAREPAWRTVLDLAAALDLAVTEFVPDAPPATRRNKSAD